MGRTYKIRVYSQGKNKAGEPYLNHSLTIPNSIADKVPEGMQFSVELVEDGILFRPVGTQSEIQEVLPAWMTSNNSGAEEVEEEEQEKKKPAPKSNARKRPARKSA